jgi:hypothetical protein
MAGLSVKELRRELSRRQRKMPVLMRRRAKVMAKVAVLDAQIRELGGSVGGPAGTIGSRKHFKNEMGLADTLVAVLKDKTMGIEQAVEAVQKAGYRTTAKSFRVMVNATLLKDKRIKRVERGKYTAK